MIVSQKVTLGNKGEGGGLKYPKTGDVIYEWPLI